MIYLKKPKHFTGLGSVNVFDGVTIENEIKMMLRNGDKPEGGKVILLYDVDSAKTGRIDADIRTDKWAIAQNALNALERKATFNEVTKVDEKTLGNNGTDGVGGEVSE